MSLSSLATAVVLPPVNLLIGAAVGWGLSWRYPRLGLGLIGLCLVLLLVMALPVTSKLLDASLETTLPTTDPVAAAQSGGPPAAIVILSAELNYGRPTGGLIPGISVGSLTLERMRAGALLARRTALPVLVAGGMIPGGTEPIAQMMTRDMKADYGVDVRWTEDRSRDTWENAQFTAEILARAGITRVYLVTHPWHMRRAMLAFRHFGLDVAPAPTLLDALPGYYFDDFVPTAYAIDDSYYALHEWVGWLAYAWRSRA